MSVHSHTQRYNLGQARTCILEHVRAQAAFKRHGDVVRAVVTHVQVSCVHDHLPKHNIVNSIA